LVLHGGLGNANYARKKMRLDNLSNTHNVLIIYANGTQAGRFFPQRFKTWNAADSCCGQASKKKVDDITYLSQLITYLQSTHHITADHTYGIGHSNGAMMLMSLMCSTPNIVVGIALAGSVLDEKCPYANGKIIYAFTGVNDTNVPISGGQGKTGIAKVNFKSQAASQTLFETEGGRYVFQSVKSDHKLDHILKAIPLSDTPQKMSIEALLFGNE
jgi:poly(3-hydroxybutyrate) depolymerase